MTRKQPENAEDLYARYFPLARATAAASSRGQAVTRTRKRWPTT